MHLSANIKRNRYLDTFDALKSMYFMLRFLTAHTASQPITKKVKIQILTQATPTFNNGINGLYHPVPQKYVCRDLVAEFFP